MQKPERKEEKGEERNRGERVESRGEERKRKGKGQRKKPRKRKCAQFLRSQEKGA